jgi:polyphenol oxidase
MIRRKVNCLELWQFDNLTRENNVRHFVTDRKPALDGEEFTLSFSSLPDKEKIRANRALVAGAMGISSDRLIFPSQVHKTRILTVTSSTTKEELMETDALITTEKNICISVMSADCVPILLFDRKNNVVAAVHSGWRGTVAKILSKTLQTLKDDFGSSGIDIIAGIGPSVSQDSYEVGEEVVSEVVTAFGNDTRLLQPQPNQKAKLDLWVANKLQLVEFGVPESHIETSDLCTVKNNHHFFSARRGDSGRFAAGIMIVSP